MTTKPSLEERAEELLTLWQEYEHDDDGFIRCIVALAHSERAQAKAEVWEEAVEIAKPHWCIMTELRVRQEAEKRYGSLLSFAQAVAFALTCMKLQQENTLLNLEAAALLAAKEKDHAQEK